MGFLNVTWYFQPSEVGIAGFVKVREKLEDGIMKPSTSGELGVWATGAAIVTGTGGGGGGAEAGAEEQTIFLLHV
jgi:hypothetical protein